uniref:Cadmium transporter n=1 Tax=uncultured Methylotenera sp. TaxID=429431 RepID=A0A6G7NPW9_9PROT|nr:cadmium transporter [uncultured Methylotenera sp.]
MLRQLINFAVSQRAFVLLVFAIMSVVGLRALKDLPIEAFPDVQDVQVQVITQVPGKAPEEVERSVTLPIEREMSGVPRVTQQRSVSITGLSVVTLIFSDGTQDRFARSQVLEKLQGVTLPPGVTPTLAPLTTAVGEIFRYVIEAPATMPLNEIRAIQDWVVRPALRRVPGVADVTSFGGTVKEIQVNADPILMRRYGVTLNQLADTLAANNDSTGGGILRRGNEGLVLRSTGLYRNIEDIQSTVIRSQNGRAVLVGDVAQVGIGDHPPSGSVSVALRNEAGEITQHEGVVEGIVMMTKGENPAIVIEDLREKIDWLNGQEHLPRGVQLKPLYDRTELINHTVHTVTHNLILGALLVVGVLIVFLRNWKISLIVASLIPLTLLFVFIMMDLFKVSANLISLGAVDFGIIIDSAVVVVEALMVRMTLQTGPEYDHLGHNRPVWRLNALKNTVSGLASPILYSKAIIILAFIPIFTFQRVEGKIFSPVALTLSCALLGAILLTLTYVPTLLAFMADKGPLLEPHLEWMSRFQQRYREKLEAMLAQPRKVYIRTAGALLASLCLIPVVGTEFLPKLDEGNIWLTIMMPPSTHLEQTREVERSVRGYMISYPETRKVITHVGRPDEGTDPKGPNNIEVLVDLAPRSEWRFSTKEELVRNMSDGLNAMPGVPTNFSQVIQDNVEESLSGVKGEIAVKIFGPDLNILQEKANHVAGILAGIQGAVEVAAIQVGGQTEITVIPDRQRMSRLGITIAEVNRTFETAMGGLETTGFFEGDRRYDVTLRMGADYRGSINDIASLAIQIPGTEGGTIPLGEIATIEVKQGASRISREAGMRAVSVKANLYGRDQGGFVKEAQRKVKRDVGLPPGYTMTWGGQFENQQRAMARLKVIAPASLLAIFGLLFWMFRSYKIAAVILAIAPTTLIGGLLGLALSGMHLSISAAVGFIAVSGIAIQNGVIMVEEIVEMLRNGKPFQQAIRDGAVLRMRPIIMTALMAGLGLLPAALSHGIGSETQRPFAVVIVGGIISATICTLFLLPVLFSRLLKQDKPAA